MRAFNLCCSVFWPIVWWPANLRWCGVSPGLFHSVCEPLQMWTKVVGWIVVGWMGVRFTCNIIRTTQQLGPNCMSPPRPQSAWSMCNVCLMWRGVTGASIRWNVYACWQSLTDDWLCVQICPWKSQKGMTHCFSFAPCHHDVSLTFGDNNGIIVQVLHFAKTDMPQGFYCCFTLTERKLTKALCLSPNSLAFQQPICDWHKILCPYSWQHIFRLGTCKGDWF